MGTQAPTHDKPTSFPYEPLNYREKEIRILEVEPGTPDVADLVKCKVRLVSLLDEQLEPGLQYEAVSYVWSLISGTADVEIEGRTVRVPAATEEALRNLRHRSGESRMLWVDAICINQDDLEERMQQVALMGDVYSKAANTLVWLGTAGEGTTRAFQGITVVHEQLLEETDHGANLRERLYGKANIFQYSTSQLPPSLDFEAIRSLFNRAWFTRRWVIQECVLAKAGTVFWGSSSMDMLKLFRAAVWIHHKQHALPFDLEAEPGMLNASYMSAFVDRTQGWFSAQHGGQTYLADLFRYFRTFNVTEERDRVYALLGLSGWQTRGEPLPRLLTPDYMKPTEDVFRDATRLAIYETRDLWVFRFIEHGPELLSQPRDRMAPSWVPCLFRAPDVDTDPNHLRSSFRANAGMPNKDRPQVSGTDTTSHPQDDANILSVDGLIVESVTAVGEPFQSDDAVNSLRNVLLKRSLGDGPSDDTLARLSIHDLANVLVGGSTFDPRPTRVNEADDRSEDIFSQFISDISCLAKDDGNGVQGVHARSQDLDSVVVDPTYARCLWAINYACVHRRLIIMSKGYVGLGPQASRPGDVLCILSGSRLPVLLRRIDNGGWHILGSCYVHGIMYGEIVKELLEVSGETEYFDLI